MSFRINFAIHLSALDIRIQANGFSVAKRTYIEWNKRKFKAITLLLNSVYALPLHACLNAIQMTGANQNQIVFVGM